VKRNWEREILMARPNDRVHVVGPDVPPGLTYDGWVVVNYDLLDRYAEELGALKWTGVVFDEAHYLKNHRSLRSRLARHLIEKAPDAVMYALTGTPLTNRPRDLFPLLQLVRHPMAKSFLSFAKRYCAAEHNGYGWVTDGASNLEELRTLLHGVMLRRTKDEVLDLPPKLRHWLPVTLPAGTARAEMRAVMEVLMTGAAERSEARARPERAKRARTPGNDRTRLLATITKARLQLSKAKVPTTIEFAEGVVEQGEKVIVFTAFDAPAKKIARHFGDSALLLTGSTPSRSRQKLVDRFQKKDEVRVFVANIVAGGIGLNLTAARQVLFHDLDWVPANHWQAEDRAYRIGQTHAVNVTYLVGEHTIDEFVRTVLTTKSALVDAVVEGKGEVAMRGDVLSELEELVRALSPGIASLGDDESGEDPVERLLREVAAAARAREASGAGDGATPARPALAQMSAGAIEALARALVGGASSTRYRVQSNSRPGTYNVLEVEGGVVSCTCAGFEYRGTCSHSRTLKLALAGGGVLPTEFALVWDDKR
jgi:SWI/SNF-related matrix-associated actin-dependent regulator 1 of chromatin subfamily A